MSPNDMMPFREDFELACRKFGWHRKTVIFEHERDWDRSWTEEVWLDRNNTRLFSEDDLEVGLVRELIRIALEYS